MIKLLAIFAIAMVFAHSSAKKERRTLRNWDYNQKIIKDSGYIIVVIVLALFAGLRIDYNDTYAYWRTFVNSSDTVSDVLNNWNWTNNPAMELYKAVIRQFSTDKTTLIFLPSLFTQYCLIRFFKKYSVEFDFSVYLFFTLGMFCFTMGAMKQSVAIGILTFAVEAAEKKKWIKFGVLVFLAFLFHTYALVFIVTPFLRARPWSAFTWLMTIGAVFVFMNLESILGSVIDAAEDAGKKIYEDEILGGTGSNIFRILVYAVPPAISFIYKKRLFADSKPVENIMVHLSILSFACMAYGLVVNANESDRLATYFEIGTVISLPWMIKKGFPKQTGKTVKTIAYAAFFIFFIYKFGIAGSFDVNYKSIISRYIG